MSLVVRGRGLLWDVFFVRFGVGVAALVVLLLLRVEGMAEKN